MIDSPSNFVNSSLSPPIKENSSPAKAEMTCNKVMAAALVVFGILVVCTFLACLVSAIIVGSTPLGVGAAAVGLIGIGILITFIACKKKPEEFLLSGNLSVRVPDYRQPSYIVVNDRPSVPQRASSGNLYLPRISSTPTVNGRVLPNSRGSSQTPVQFQPNSRSFGQNNGNVIPRQRRT